MPIKSRIYNAHLQNLANAGSIRARKGHPAHDDKDVPNDYGQSLIDEAQADERDMLKAGKVKEAAILHEAIQKAKADFHFV
ncbi:MAG: hypothetical protein ACI32O_05705 [Enterococcus sp.]